MIVVEEFDLDPEIITYIYIYNIKTKDKINFIEICNGDFAIHNKEYIITDFYGDKQVWDIKSGKEITHTINFFNLNLKDSQLINISREIGKLINLTYLDLSNNNIVELPKEICNLVNLTELDLGGNQLIWLPKEVINLTNLTVLGLHHNPNLILTQEQKEWIRELGNNGCEIYINDNLLDETNIIEEILDIKANFMSNKFNGLLVDINNIDGIEIYNKSLYLKTKYQGKILIYTYDEEYEAQEDKITFQRILNNELCKVILIDDRYGLSGYDANSNQYRELQMGFNLNINEDEIPF